MGTGVFRLLAIAVMVVNVVLCLQLLAGDETVHTVGSADLAVSAPEFVNVTGHADRAATLEFLHQYDNGPARLALVPIDERGHTVLLLSSEELAALDFSKVTFTGLASPLLASFQKEAGLDAAPRMMLKLGQPKSRKPVALFGLLLFGGLGLVMLIARFRDASLILLPTGPHQSLPTLKLPGQQTFVALAIPCLASWFLMDPGLTYWIPAGLMAVTSGLIAATLLNCSSFASSDSGFTISSGFSGLPLTVRIEDLASFEVLKSSHGGFIQAEKGVRVKFRNRVGDTRAIHLANEHAAAAELFATRVVKTPAAASPPQADIVPAELQRISERLRPVDLQKGEATVLLFVSIVGTAVLWSSLVGFERTGRSAVPLHALVISIYRLTGRWGILAICAAAALSVGRLWFLAHRRENALISEVGPEMILRARLLEQSKVPAWMRWHREDGRLTPMAWVSVAIGVAFLVLALVLVIIA